MAARPIFREKHFLSDGSVVEMVIWQLPRLSPDRPHGIKYRLYFGLANGTALVRYDNESGKGDHRHYRDSGEQPYVFVDVETLIKDFLVDVANAGRSKR
jgi:hypothetical protein